MVTLKVIYSKLLIALSDLAIIEKLGSSNIKRQTQSSMVSLSTLYLMRLSEHFITFTRAESLGPHCMLDVTILISV